MSRFCPWCREPLTWRERKEAKCPHCDRALVENGSELRPIDLRYEEVGAAQCERYRQMQIYGLAVVGGVSLGMPLLNIGAALAVPLLMVGHMLALRLFLIRDARQLLGKARRMFTRWIARFSFLWIGSVGYGMAVVPLFGAVIALVTFGGLTALVHHYTLWSFDRERQRLPLALWEKVLLITLALLTVVLMGVVLVLAFLFGLGVAWLIEIFQGGQ